MKQIAFKTRKEQKKLLYYYLTITYNYYNFLVTKNDSLCMYRN